jgi:hypothetical protein
MQFRPLFVDQHPSSHFTPSPMTSVSQRRTVTSNLKKKELLDAIPTVYQPCYMDWSNLHEVR